ncbi:MAG: FapA family protein [Treponemataceae bacterium]
MAVTLEKIRQDIADMLNIDKNLRFVDVLADSLEEALKDAAVQLDTKVNFLEYEVLERGSKGVLGFMKKNWKIRAYEVSHVTAAKLKSESEDDSDSLDAEVAAEILDKDGVFFVRRFGSEIFLKVELPIGNGDAVDLKEVMNEIRNSDTVSFDEAVVKKSVKNGTDGEYVVVGIFNHNAAYDANLVIDISPDDLHAMVTLTAPGSGGAEISAEQIKRNLLTQGVLAGVNDEKIQELVDNPIYGVPVEVASAILPVDGKNAYIKYNFETDRSKLRAKESKSGQIDYKELNIIQNVVEGQPLAQKIPPERGKTGKTLSGRLLEAKNGKDINLPLGQNVYVDDDGVTICAKINGQVLLVGDKITVAPVYLVEGDVCIKTGNISFLGNVIVKGSVEDGYDIKASGNVEISGSVGKCNIDADGNVVVQGIIMGRDEGSIRAGKSMWAKSIQNMKVDVEESIYVTDAIMNSEVFCNQKVFINGKKAAIIGSHVSAIECVYTKNIGSSGGGSETIVEVGIDPRAKKRLLQLQSDFSKLMKKLEEVELDIDNLENIKKTRKRLPLDKEKILEERTEQKNEITAESEKMNEEIQQIQDRLRELKAVGKISASGTVYSGSKIYVRDVIDDIHADITGVTFFWEGGFVRRGKYEPPAEGEATRVPDGYSAN